MKRPRKRQEQPCLVRMGAMERPRDVHPGFVPVQVIDTNGGEPLEMDISSREVNAYEALATLKGISLARIIEKVIVAAVRRDLGEGACGE